MRNNYDNERVWRGHYEITYISRWASEELQGLLMELTNKICVRYGVR